MADIVDQSTRSRMMAGIRSKDTRPERLIRSGLHRLGFRFRLHSKDVLGNPDLVFPKYHAAIFVHGCFWHGHDCSLFKFPSTRTEFWKTKIQRNRVRDQEVCRALDDVGWRHLTVWECAFRGPHRIGEDKTIMRIVSWLRSRRRCAGIRGTG